ncbi:hypothetical protein HK100_004970 [Physocladia obscura]|uniref:Peptidase C14 caspase domain-containing protein n=1 Tax=Physocladia obscura TaxID=109957 RepID=A0AAD5XC78_9FUNG|nr:hypothetical protein HK100_004970 [Physocladia obscura]
MPREHHEHSLNHARAYAGGHKKALLIGINYTGTAHALKGCIADVQHMKEFLVAHRGYHDTPESLVFMADDAPLEHHRPTHRNLVAAFQWLVVGNTEGDSLFLHYSGHGAQMAAKADTSRDRKQDCIVPLDYESTGCIEADFLHRALVHALPVGVKLTVVFDCCHSGTMLELPYTYRPTDEQPMAPKKKPSDLLADVESILHRGFTPIDIHVLLEDVAGLSALFPHRDDVVANGGVDSLGYKHEHFAGDIDPTEKSVVVISGCEDDQTSADTVVQGYGNTGALSYAIVSKLKADGGRVNYESLLAHARQFMIDNKLTQIPQLSCGMEVDPTGSFEF